MIDHPQGSKGSGRGDHARDRVADSRASVTRHVWRDRPVHLGPEDPITWKQREIERGSKLVERARLDYVKARQKREALER